MKFFRFTTLLVVAILVAGVAFAQGNPTSTLTGRVINEGQALPGVNVTVKSPSLMGTRSAITSINARADRTGESFDTSAAQISAALNQ